MNTYLLIFLFVDAILVGIIGVLAWQHFEDHQALKKLDKKRLPETGHLSSQTKQQMQEQALKNFESVIDKYTSQLQKDLRFNEESLSTQMKKLNASIAEKEAGRYQQELAKIHSDIVKTDEASNEAIKTEQNKLMSQLEQDIATEKERRLGLLDQKITDIVMSFLYEALGHDVDLGSQTKYLLKRLDDNKKEIIEGLKHEA